MESENFLFYENLDIEDFRAFEKGAGLDTCPDLVHISRYLEDVGSILELGSGYGRCLEYLIKNFECDVDGVEFTDKYFSFLKNRYPQKVGLYQQDICEMDLPRKYDLVLCLWGTLIVVGDSIKNQHKIISGVYDHLNDEGLFIFDSPRNKCQSFGDDLPEKKVQVEHNGFSCFGYLGDENDYGSLSKKIGFSSFWSDELDVTTDVGINERIFYFMKK